MRLRRAILHWARSHDRPLPWRGERDPYRVLVSEVMLQQTQASRVAVAYPHFLERFPTVDALAAADAGDVLRAWGTLGYPRRARDLWRAAQAIVAEGFPRTPEELQSLPGIGPYTARAVASFAFGVDVGVVEANVRRIFGRYFGATEDLQILADELVPPGRAAEWNQALMDLGADVCRPRMPRCDRCPLTDGCRWDHDEQTVTERRRGAPFEQTHRFARGRVLDELRRRSGLSLDALIERTSLDADRVADAVSSLCDDELVHLDRGRVRLGPQRARERRSATSATT